MWTTALTLLFKVWSMVNRHTWTLISNVGLEDAGVRTYIVTWWLGDTRCAWKTKSHWPKVYTRNITSGRVSSIQRHFGDCQSGIQWILYLFYIPLSSLWNLKEGWGKEMCKSLGCNIKKYLKAHCLDYEMGSRAIIWVINHVSYVCGIYIPLSHI